MGLTVDADISDSIDLFGKSVTDLQSDIAVSDDAIEGILNFVDDYTDFSEDETLQSGNYIAIHAFVPDVEDVTIEVNGGDSVALDEAGITIIRITDKDSQTITVVASNDEYDSVTKEFSLSGLICEEEATNTDPG